MTSRRPYDARSRGPGRDTGARRRSGYPPAPDGSVPEPRRRGPHLGPIALTPVRVFLLIALVGGLGFLLWSVVIRDQLQVPLMATGFAICGIVFALMAVMSVFSVVRSGRAGRDGAAVMTALAGGLIAVASMLCLAAAVIFSLIWGATPGS
jgi:hypothetical protein